MASFVVGVAGDQAAGSIEKMNVKTMLFTALVGAVAILAGVAAWNYVTGMSTTTTSTP